MGPGGQPTHREPSMVDHPPPAGMQPTGSGTGQNDLVRKGNWDVTGWALWLVLLLTWPATVSSMLLKSALRSFSEVNTIIARNPSGSQDSLSPPEDISTRKHMTFCFKTVRRALRAEKSTPSARPDGRLRNAPCTVQYQRVYHASCPAAEVKAWVKY